MENKGLVFIPDISGFSRFVNETEIDHSRRIIQELLEVLINANQIGLEVSEIEGDAILFYKFGDPPALEALYKQVEYMFRAFHRNLGSYELRKYCQCKACLSAINLSLKVITHYGEFAGYTVKNFSKLIGKDIIVAHQLLKNDIEQHEYWLVTKSLLAGGQPVDFADWMKWNAGAKQTDSGDVAFQYTQLSQLKNKLPVEQLPPPKFTDKVKVISVTRDYETDIITLFHATGDFRFRNQWQEGVLAVEEIDHYLPRVGMRCRCTLQDGKVVTYTSNFYQFAQDRIQFMEANENEKSITSYTLEKIGPRKMRFTLDLYHHKTFPATVLFRIFRKKETEHAFQRSLQNIDNLLKEIKIPNVEDYL